MINETNETTAAQFSAAPRALKLGGHVFARRDAIVFNNETNTIFADYFQLFAEEKKIRVSVRYDDGCDTYHVTLTHVQIMECVSTIIVDLEEVYEDMFSRVQEWIETAERQMARAA